MFLSSILDYHVDIVNSPQLRVRVEKHFVFSKLAGIVLRLREVSANLAAENKRSHMFEVGTMKRKSMSFEVCITG